ncbi:hypothetical protein PGT21_006636 [Puccinia graminis f. sp. tritici]|uniref:4'-phosphopantetheinyl transferase domain-containing protein n=1 Tax=Puccinia graminis f. sp. tritici TaxID=56615 RepID=A0A5B0N3H5_PUCGR|nr:hypothetical protein PGT21_006636 [Puccinia graminis f. sp. tritici]KAA1122872.1 hypothetical protein PGTUg99_007121 [Puccinia graminis f. sp. tritici]
MILGLGIDILDRSRLARLLVKKARPSQQQPQRSIRTRLAERILSGRERDSVEWQAVLEKDAASGSDGATPSTELVSYLANRWTAKEAAYKALYPGYQPSWKELSLLKGVASQPKKPVLLFHPSSSPSSGSRSDPYQLHPHITLLVSIAHDGPFTVASVIANSSSSSSASTEHDNTRISSS